MNQPDEIGLTDHGLPLVRLKHRRREMIVALQIPHRPSYDDELRKIAAIRQTIGQSAHSRCRIWTAIQVMRLPAKWGHPFQPSDGPVRVHSSSVITDGCCRNFTGIRSPRPCGRHRFAEFCMGFGGLARPGLSRSPAIPRLAQPSSANLVGIELGTRHWLFVWPVVFKRL